MSKHIDFRGWFFNSIRRIRIKLKTSLYSHFVRIYCILRGLRVGKGVVFDGYPNIYRAPFSRISIGNKCKFNSSRISVRSFLYRRCAFATINKDAEIIFGNNSGATGVSITAGSSIKIGDNVMIGAYTTIVDTDFHHTDPNKREDADFPARPIVIEDNAFIGMNCMILKGVTIGKNAVIGANSVVLRDIPPDTVALGNPCKILIKRNWESSQTSKEPKPEL